MIQEKKLKAEPPQEALFTEEQWIDMVDRISTLFHFSPMKRARMTSHKIMKLVAALPFLADCRNPQRIALSHLATYVIAASDRGKDIFLHNFSDNDNLFTRLERISHFDGGNEIIIKRGMNILALAMLADHKMDSVEDKRNRKYNPINMGAWKFENANENLRKEVLSVSCPKMDEILDIGPGIESYWDV